MVLHDVFLVDFAHYKAFIGMARYASNNDEFFKGYIYRF